ncbi:VWA-like domain-containing protein [bacterium]|nr:VWA-like domain-containing protein [bacterium]
MTTFTAEETKDRLITSRVQLLLNNGFFGNLATRLQLQDASDWCPTAATDGRFFFYNKEFIDSLDDEELIFLMGHEVLHNVYDHMDRRGDRDPRLWNIANDYVVNMDLVENNIGKKITKVQICFDYKYQNMFSDEVYDDLFENAEHVTEETLDMHLDFSDEDGDGQGAQGNAEGGDDDKKGPPQYSEEERRQIQDEMKEAIMNAAKSAGNKDVPRGVRHMIKNLTNPELDWRELLATNIQSVVKNDFTFMRPARKGIAEQVYLPGMDYDTDLDVFCFIDSSGSMMDEMLRDLCSEVKGIMEQYTNFKLRLCFFDTDTYTIHEFDSTNIEDIHDIEVEGGGGTEFDCMFDRLKAEDIIPQKLIVFTDGYPWGSWGDEDYCDTLFIVHGAGYGGRTPVAPYGVTVKYKANEKT